MRGVPSADGPGSRALQPSATICNHLWLQVRVDPEVEHFLHEFWGMIGHLVNTIIFVISGVSLACDSRVHSLRPGSSRRRAYQPISQHLHHAGHRSWLIASGCKSQMFASDGM